MSEHKNELEANVLSALEKAGVTVEAAKEMTVQDLVKIKGVGEASANKIVAMKSEDVNENENDVDVEDETAEGKMSDVLDAEAARVQAAENVKNEFGKGSYEFEFVFIDGGDEVERHKIRGSGGSEDAAIRDARQKADTYSNGRYGVVYSGNFKKTEG